MESQIVTEANVLQHVAVLITRVDAGEAVAVEQKRVTDMQHDQNQKAIHSLRNGQQTITDLIHTNQVAVMECLSAINQKLARYAGWVAGGVFVAGIAVEMAKYMFDHMRVR